MEVDVGVLRGKRLDHLSMEWNIHNYFTSCKKGVTALKSPEFIFGGCAWCLNLYPFVHPFQDNIHNAEIYLERLESSITAHDVSFTIGIKNRDGTIYKSCECTFTFDKRQIIEGYSEHDSKTIMLDAQSDFAIEDTLTVFVNDLILHKMIVENKQSAILTDEELNIMANLNINWLQIDDTNSNIEDTAIPLRNWNLKDLYLDKECNVTFKVENCRIHANRGKLAARSPVFASMFNNNMPETNTGNVNIPDCGREALIELLRCIYSEKVDLKSSVVAMNLYEASEKYDLRDLQRGCVEFMKNNISTDTLCEILAIAVKYKDTKLINFATNFFAANMRRIMPTLRWQIFLKENTLAANNIIIKSLEKCFL